MDNEEGASKHTSFDVSATAPTPFHVAALMGDFDLMKSFFDANFPYPLTTDGNSPLAIAASEPCYYRLVTLLCLHGADPLLELPPGMLGDLCLLVATKLNSVGDTEDDYERRFMLTLVYTKALHIIASVASGVLEEETGAALLHTAKEEEGVVLSRYAVSHKQLEEEVRGYIKD